ncbi:lambda exonuclease family protein [uncultured Bartonella sp.]|uniref:lambda exonuclease family protein n=1 Tax=uncultured Bartonella sp. TaxID=104108 RepID=UPI0025E557E0|nr:lambda exonuclease family protein [uncultured Bartonella sp.]
MSEILQRTPEWFELRLGKVTASRIGDLMAKTRSGYSASRANYMTELAIQRLTGAVGQGFTSPAMQWGTEQESNARNAYSFFTENEVEEIAFINHPTIEQAGASPDGLVGDDGLVEIKCPNTATHLDTLLTGKINNKYILQMQWQMACSGRKWCDFVSFDPRFPEDLKIFIKRVERDDKLIAEITAEVKKFLAELDEIMTQLKQQAEAA